MWSRPAVHLSLIVMVLATSLCALAQEAVAPERPGPRNLQVKNVKLLAYQQSSKGGKSTEVLGFREVRGLRLFPSDKFDVTCDLVGGIDAPISDYLLWTTVDFLVAPMTRAFEQMDDNKLASSVRWGQVAEMQDLKAIRIAFL